MAHRRIDASAELELDVFMLQAGVQVRRVRAGTCDCAIQNLILMRLGYEILLLF